MEQRQNARGSWRGSRARWTVAAVIIAGLAAFAVYAAFAGISGTAAVKEEPSPAQVEPIGTSGINRLVLSDSAAERLGITTEPVRTAVVAGRRRIVIPYAAVVYDADGVAWAYTNPKPLTFIRSRLVVDHVAGAQAFVSAGPPAGARVVTVGAAELFGSEIEFDEG